MTTDPKMRTNDDDRNLQIRTVNFEGHPVTAVHFRGRWVWRGIEAGEAIGYERGRIERRVRLALRWDARWCLFPTAREGELVLALREEERLVERIAERAARDRQLALRPVGAPRPH